MDVISVCLDANVIFEKKSLSSIVLSGDFRFCNAQGYVILSTLARSVLACTAHNLSRLPIVD